MDHNHRISVRVNFQEILQVLADLEVCNSNIARTEELLNEAIQQGSQTMPHYANLGHAYKERYIITHKQQDLDSAIITYKDGLDNCPGTTEQQSRLWDSLVVALLLRYNWLDIVLDFWVSTRNQHGSLTLNIVTNRNQTITVRVDVSRGLEVLNRNIARMEEALNEAIQQGSQTMPHYLNLGHAYQKRYGTTHEQQDLNNSITTYKNGLDNCPGTIGQQSQLWDALGGALLAKYNLLRILDYLEESVLCHSKAVRLCQTGNAIVPGYLSNLGAALTTRYEQLGEMQDLDRAISSFEQVLDWHLVGHPNRSVTLNNLGRALDLRYRQLGGMEDLAKVVSYYEQALDLKPAGHPDRPKSLNILAHAFNIRYRQLGEMEDLEKVIGLHQEALDLCPVGHPDRLSFLSNLAGDLGTKYKEIGEMEDLEKAIDYHEQALELCPIGHPDRSSHLSSHASTLRTRYGKLGQMMDLEKAISHHKEALDLCPVGHPDRSHFLSGLAISLTTRYYQLEDMKDLEMAINYHKQALDLCPVGHNSRSATLNSLGSTHYLVYQKSRSNQFLGKTIDFHREAALATPHLQGMLAGAKQWAYLAHTHKLPSETPAYSLAMNLLHQHIAVLPSLALQQEPVEKSSFLSLDAAAWAIETGILDTAVQHLEQGRSILWSKIQGFRQPLKDIGKKAPHLAKEFREVSHMLQYNATSGETDISLHNSQYKRWITLLEKIRALEGFSDFLQATPFDTLKEACAEGPVIMVNISDFRSDAIILVVDSPPILVPLQDAAPQRLKGLADQLLGVGATSGSSKITYNILHSLWNTIVQPVVVQLKQLQVPEKSHIWWCPTSYLCALPLHAAGLYQQGTKNLPDLYISSYTPTLASLIRARSNISKHRSDLSLLLVSQPDDTIPQVFEEAKVINRVKAQVSSLSGHDMKREGILESLKSHPWVHFACHGHLEVQPFHSWFQLYNKEHLTILDLAQAQLPNAEFAFLSACHSAASKVHGTPDEYIHLAAALQVSGFGSVIGTLWAMVDDDGPPLADTFYEEIIDDLGNVDVRDAAKALNLATKELRRKKVPVERWINFVHFGA